MSSNIVRHFHSKIVRMNAPFVFVAKLASEREGYYLNAAKKSVMDQAKRQGLNPEHGKFEIVPPRRTKQGVMWYELHLKF